MAKYSEKLGKKISEAIEQDSYTLGEICTIHHISRKTFYQWMRKYTEFNQMVEDARISRDEHLALKARQILKQRLEQGYTITTTRYKYAVDDYGELYLTGKTVTMKEYSADETTLKMALSKETEIEEKAENIQSPLEIIVQDEKAADQLHLLSDRLSGNFTKEEFDKKQEKLRLKQPDTDTSTDTIPNTDDYEKR